jgi:hypothetical protein
VNNNWNDIEKLFKSSLGNNPGGEPVDPWTGIEKRVIRSNFFRFSAATFNVYYLTIIMVFISSLGFSAYKAVSYKWELTKKNGIIRQYQRKGLEEKIKVYLADSVKTQTDTAKLKNNKEENPVENNKHDSIEKPITKKAVNGTLVKQVSPDVLPDTITRVFVKKKVIKKQLFLKKPQQVKDSIVIK